MFDLRAASVEAVDEVGSFGLMVDGVTATLTALRPVGTGGEADFYVYAVYLKSGDAAADEDARLAEAHLLRADGLGPASIVYSGDFNWAGVDERGADPVLSAWDAFTAGGNGQASDATGASGAWRDNASFVSLHTQDPGAAMDDRFDVQLISGELADGIGLDFVAGSFAVVGNNGTHGLNGVIGGHGGAGRRAGGPGVVRPPARVR